MRNTFSSELKNIADRDERVILLMGDIGNTLFDDFRNSYPKRFYNCGVAEQNMISMAAGMASTGLRPFVYTIASFATARCFEQIKIDVCYQNLPVVIVGTGAGLSYGQLGPTHHSCEDIGILRTLPNITICCPGDPVEVKLAMRECVKHDGPIYLRLGKQGEPIVHVKEPNFEFGTPIKVVNGSKSCVILSTGNTLPLAVDISQICNSKGMDKPTVFSVHTVKPIDELFIKNIADQNYKFIVTIEEHSEIGGLSEMIASHDYLRGLEIIRFNLKDKFQESATQDYLRKKNGLETKEMSQMILNVWKCVE